MRTPPYFFGIGTPLTGGGKYLPPPVLGRISPEKLQACIRVKNRCPDGTVILVSRYIYPE